MVHNFIVFFFPSSVAVTKLPSLIILGSLILVYMLYVIFSPFQRIPLDFLQGDQFRGAADEYVRPKLTKVTTNYRSSIFLRDL
jgi:hypothetical protein